MEIRAKNKAAIGRPHSGANRLIQPSWENQSAVGVRLEDLDHEEILRTRQAAIEQRRISGGTSTDVGDILDRLGLRRDGVITQAAQILYGTRWLPDYPQGMLKLGRFRGTKITGAILDNKQDHMHAFAIVRETMAWLDRTLPLAARFPPGEIFREDRLPVPAEALREALLNAVMHRDYSDPGSYVAVAVFDDRIEVRSSGTPARGLGSIALRPPQVGAAESAHRRGLPSNGGRRDLGPRHEPDHRGVRAPRHRAADVRRGERRPVRDVPGGDRANSPSRRTSHRTGCRTSYRPSRRTGPSVLRDATEGQRDPRVPRPSAPGDVRQELLAAPPRQGLAGANHPGQAHELAPALPHDGCRREDPRGGVVNALARVDLSAVCCPVCVCQHEEPTP
jgi:hypothetical protein